MSKRKRIRSECRKDLDLDLNPSLKRTKMEQLPTEILVDIFKFLNITRTMVPTTVRSLKTPLINNPNGPQHLVKNTMI